MCVSRSATTRRLVASLRICALLALLAASSAPALARQIPGSRVVLDVPASYTAATRFSGYVDEPRGISIVVVEFPAVAYDEIAKGMTVEALASQQMTNAERATLTRTGDYLYFTAEQAQAGTIYGKFLLVTRDKGVTVIVTVNVPKARLDAGDATAAEMETILTSARVADTAAAEKSLYTLGYLGPFKRAGLLAGTATLYTLDGVLAPATPDPSRAFFVAAPSLDERPVNDLDAFARRALEGTGGFTDVVVTGTRALTVAGLRGVELTATANDAREKRAMGMYQAVIVLSSGGYVRLLGQASAAEFEKLLPEFRRMAESYTPTPK